jgi:hypothetical protein
MGNLGTLLIHDKEFSEARPWYEKGALGGDASAMNGLAWLYEQGLGGLHQDFTEARAGTKPPPDLVTASREEICSNWMNGLPIIPGKRCSKTRLELALHSLHWSSDLRPVAPNSGA